MKIESRKCISIRKIAEYHETDVAAIPPQIYTVTGFVTTFFYILLVKLKFLKNFSVVKKNSGFYTQIVLHAKFQKHQLKMFY